MHGPSHAMLHISTYLYIIYLRVQIRVNQLINKLKTYFMPVSIHLNYLDEENLNWFKTNIFKDGKVETSINLSVILHSNSLPVLCSINT